MRYATVAIALTGVATAQWEGLLSTTKKEVDPTTTWSAWTSQHPDPTGWAEVSGKTTTTKSQCAYVTEVPVKKCIPEGSDKCFEYKSKTTIYADTCTWSDWVDPSKKTTSTWGDWETWATPAPTAKCSYVKDVVTKICDVKRKDYCWYDKHATTIYPDNCDDKASWATWEPVAPTATCSYVTAIPVKKCSPKDDSKCVTKTITHTIYPTDCADWSNWEKTKGADAKQTWYEWPVDPTETWVGWDSTKTVKATETETAWESAALVTSVVKPAWSKDGWFGPAWPTNKDKDGCVMNVVTSYGAAIWVPVPGKPQETEKPKETWSAVVDPKPKETWSVVVSAKETWATYQKPSVVSQVVQTTWAEVVKSETAKPAQPQKPQGHAPIKPNGNKWAMAYSPFDEQSKCKTKEVIRADIKKLADAGFTSVRVYSTQCETLEFVGAACEEFNLTIIIGVFIKETGIAGAKDQVQAIKEWAKWELVELIVVGNEALHNKFCQPEELIAFIQESKSVWASAGYQGPCTTTEPLDAWQQYGSQFCSVVDVVSANLYAFFNQDCEASNAGTFIQAEIDILAKICPGKETYVMESGWPSEGQCFGKACPSKQNQAIAIKSIQETCGEKIVFFSFEDDLWKQPGQYGVEQHWGCADLFAKDYNWSQWGSPAPAKPSASSKDPVNWATWSSTTTAKKADPTAWGSY